MRLQQNEVQRLIITQLFGFPEAGRTKATSPCLTVPSLTRVSEQHKMILICLDQSFITHAAEFFGHGAAIQVQVVCELLTVKGMSNSLLCFCRETLFR